MSNSRCTALVEPLAGLKLDKVIKGGTVDANSRLGRLELFNAILQEEDTALTRPFLSNEIIQDGPSRLVF